MPSARTWDIFCKVIDNHGDLGVCWRLARDLATRGHRARLWIDQAQALTWMAPGGHAGVQVRAWNAQASEADDAAPGDVVIEAFGCELDAGFVARMAARRPAPAWINLEYLSAERWVERCHGLRSPVLAGPGAGLDKFFFYPGFTSVTGGLLRESDLIARQRTFDRAAWLRSQGVPWQPGDRVVSLFCYEPAALPGWLEQLAGGPRTHLLVTPGRATGAVRAALRHGAHAPSVIWLPHLAQPAFDELLWASDFNFVRGEDSLVRALWADRPFVWQIYPQHDDAHHAKLDAFLDWLRAPASLRAFTRVWNGVDAGPLPPMDAAAWGDAASQARERALQQTDLTSQLEAFVHTMQAGHAATPPAPPTPEDSIP